MMENEIALGVAAGTASALGLVNLKSDARPTTAHLLLPGRCSFRCGYCARAADGTGLEFLSRIRWPSFGEGAVYRAISERRAAFERACIQVVQTGDWIEQALRVIKNLRRSALPISLATRPIPAVLVGRLLAAGANRIGLPIDVASARLYRRLRGGDYERDVGLIEEAARTFRGRISTHIIVGVGERGDELVDAMLRLHRSGAAIALFAFTPCPGTKMATRAPPDLSRYRRAQVARYLIERGMDVDFAFDPDGEIADFGFSRQELRGIVGPSAFQTSGCPGCNRPFYNERPSGPMYNYPRPLTGGEHEEGLRLIGEKHKNLADAPTREECWAKAQGQSGASFSRDSTAHT